MDPSVLLGIIGVLATLAVGLPVFFMKRRDSARSGAVGGGISIQQHLNSWHRDSNDTHTHTHLHGGVGPGSDGFEEAIAYGLLLLGMAVAYWSARAYVVAAVGGLLVGSAVLAWAAHRWTGPQDGSGHGALLAAAFAVLAVDLGLLVFPGLLWGDAFRVSWTYIQGIHVHGLGFVLAPLLVLAAMALGLLLLLSRGLTVVAVRLELRSKRPTPGTMWRWLARHLGALGWQPGTPLLAVAFAIFGLVIAVIWPHLQPAHVAVHPATVGR